MQRKCRVQYVKDVRYLDFRLRVLKIGNALDEPGTVNWDLALCLLLAWIICYLCVFKGVKSTGKVRDLGIYCFGYLQSGTKVVDTLV